MKKRATMDERAVKRALEIMRKRAKEWEKKRSTNPHAIYASWAYHSAATILEDAIDYGLDYVNMFDHQEKK